MTFINIKHDCDIVTYRFNDQQFGFKVTAYEPFQRKKDTSEKDFSSQGPEIMTTNEEKSNTLQVTYS